MTIAAFRMSVVRCAAFADLPQHGLGLQAVLAALATANTAVHRVASIQAVIEVAAYVMCFRLLGDWHVGRQ